MMSFLWRLGANKILNFIDFPCQIRDKKARIIATNASGKTFFGTKNPFLFCQEEQLPALQKLENAFHKGAPVQVCIALRHEIYDITLMPFGNYMMLQAHNITAQQHIYQNLEQQLEAFTKSFDLMPQAVYLADEKGILLYANTCCKRLLQAPTDITGHPLDRYVQTQQLDFGGAWEGVCPLKEGTERLKITQFPLENTEKPLFCALLEPYHPHDLDNQSLFQNLLLPSLLINPWDEKIIASNASFQKSFSGPLPESLNTLIDNASYETLHTKLQKWTQGGALGPVNMQVCLAPLWGHKVCDVYFSPATSEKDIFVMTLIDASRQKDLEVQVGHAQKMQAMGQLVGGIAHDFNNLLTAITGFCDLLLGRCQNSPDAADILQIKGNAHKAAGLIGQLLTFSRKQPVQLTPLSVHDALLDLTALLKRTLTPKITLQTDIKRSLGVIYMDPNQWTQIFLNLAVNAKDAMPQGGVFKITALTENLRRAKRCGADTLRAGTYVKIIVSDTGCGIHSENLSHIFEPFWTTKAAGGTSGTGLGLSTVYGIINAQKGAICVDSEPNIGTTFTLYFPQSAKKQAPLSKEKTPVIAPVPAGQQKKILLVDDEDGVRLIASRALRQQGYTVIPCPDGPSALNLLKQEKFDLLLTDMIMPQMNGEELCHKARVLSPDLRMILMSGYTADLPEIAGANQPFAFLQKPFDIKGLLDKVSQVLHI